MIGLLFWVVIGAALLFVVPPLLAPYTGGNRTIGAAVRALGVLLIFFGVLTTSYVHVPDGHLGQLFRVYGGGSLPEGVEGGPILDHSAATGCRLRAPMVPKAERF
jgi:hypothetical protein